MPSPAENICTNYQTCRLVNVNYIVPDAGKKEIYISSYCRAGETAWNSCKRYITKKALNFCPDFVLPDSPGTPEDIMNKFDDDMNVNKSAKD